MPSAQGVTSAVERAESAYASVSTDVPRLLKSVRVRRVRNGRRETAGVNSCLRVTSGRNSMKSSRAAVGRFPLDLEFPNPVSEEAELLFNSFLVRRAAHRSGMWASQRKGHRGWSDIGRGGGRGAGPGGEFGVGGREHEGSRLFVKVGSSILIISRVM